MTIDSILKSADSAENTDNDNESSKTKDMSKNKNLAYDIKYFINRVAEGHTLSQEDSQTAFTIITSGEASPAQMGAFLMALRVRGESVDEIIGAVKALRARMINISAPSGAIDTCGTGGDAKGTFNISTAASFVVAGCGVPVAKHGNRAQSSKSGAADVLAALGVNIDADLSLVEGCLEKAGICFLMAPRYHAAMRHVGPTRIELGTRTIFNLLGPLLNPAKVKRQVFGVFAREWVSPLAAVLQGLGHEKAWVVYGADGLDELSTTGTSYVAELKNGNISDFSISPEDVGLPRAKLSDLKGGDPSFNAKALRAMLEGEKGPLRDIVLYNSAAALVVADKADTMTQGLELAASSIDAGHAKAALDNLIDLTNRSKSDA